MNKKINSLTTGHKQHIHEPSNPDKMSDNLSLKTDEGETKINGYAKVGLERVTVRLSSELGSNSHSDKKSSNVIRPISTVILIIKSIVQSNDLKSPINPKTNAINLRKEVNQK